MEYSVFFLNGLPLPDLIIPYRLNDLWFITIYHRQITRKEFDILEAKKFNDKVVFDNVVFFS